MASPGVGGEWREAGSPHPIGRLRRWVSRWASRLARFLLRDYPGRG